MALMELKQISKSYQNGATSILKEVNLTLLSGQTVAIVGASGAGKSTLLHLMGGLDQPTSGEIFYNNQKITTLNEEGRARWRNAEVGFVFQFHHLLPDFTVLENVILPLLIRGISKKEAAVEGVSWLKKVGIIGREEARPDQLSGGEQQRVALARALVHRPRLLLADEPTGNLDTHTGEKVFDLLLGLNKELGTTLVIVTHNEFLAGKLSKCIRIIDGQIVS